MICFGLFTVFHSISFSVTLIYNSVSDPVKAYGWWEWLDQSCAVMEAPAEGADDEKWLYREGGPTREEEKEKEFCWPNGTQKRALDGDSGGFGLSRDHMSSIED